MYRKDILMTRGKIMQQTIYKRSMYDRFCRAVVGLGLLYGAFAAGEHWQERKQQQIPYQVIVAGDQYLLMEQKSKRTAPLEPNILFDSQERNQSTRHSIDEIVR